MLGLGRIKQISSCEHSTRQAAGAAGQETQLPYRPDIDGLRGVAVIAVVLFHVHWWLVPGGYIGVDIFFVISGYLITRLLIHSDGDYAANIVRFYIRRIRRILPALLVLLMFVVVVAHLLFLPGDIRPFMTDVAAATLFVSNMSAQTAVTYFERAYEVRPLLHTWSLAIEEQFYLVFPFLALALLRRGRRDATIAIMLLTAGSLAWSIHLVSESPTPAFFSTLGRAWELGIGALLAAIARPFPMPPLVGQFMAAASVVVIGVAIELYSSATPFPGLAAVLPVLATAALIQTGRETVVAKYLGSRPAVAVGRMSYSIYLWHWPLIVVGEYALAEKLAGFALLAVLGLAVLAAWLSWKFVEVPFHKKLELKTVMAFVGIASTLILATAMVAKLAQGWPERFSPTALKLAAAASDFNPRRAECHRTDGFAAPPSQSCVYGSGPTRIAVWGDSHGVELSAALGERAEARGQSVAELTYSSCPPSLTMPGPTGCRRFNAATLAYLLHSKGVEVVILVAKYDDPALRNDWIVLDGIARSAWILAAAGKRVVLLYPVPMQPGPVPRALALRSNFGFDLAAYGTKRADFLSRNAAVLAFLDSIRAPGLIRVRPHDVLCDLPRCASVRNGQVLYFDDNHLSLSGARYLAPLFDRLFDSPRSAHGDS